MRRHAHHGVNFAKDLKRVEAMVRTEKNCVVTMSVESLDSSMTTDTCSITLTQRRAHLGLGVVIEPSAQCPDLRIDSQINLTDGGPDTGETSLLASRAVRAKTTGQDSVNIDMIWTIVTLHWQYDGWTTWGEYYTKVTGHNAFWNETIGVGWLDTSSPFTATAVWQQSWHSDGFPFSFMPDVGAMTDVRSSGTQSGTGSCSFNHYYYLNASQYPNLHWLDECFYV